jgi:VWFA-related protein
VELLANVAPNRDRAVVVMTDGIDLNSEHSLLEVIAQAKKNKVRIYTVGIGAPGTFEKVSTALVLDHSGSMKAPAETSEKYSKITAMHLAAARFIKGISTTGRVSVIPFSSFVGKPRAFTNNKLELISNIQNLAAIGETALFDAIYNGISTVDADDPPGRRAVVAMTDGMDNASHRRVEEVIARAKEARIPLYLLGFGRDTEIDSAVMQRMAKESGGEFYHARTKDDLVEIFESLTIKLHDDGIDEDTLTKLAVETGGQYYPAQNVSELKIILEQVTQGIQRKQYVVKFDSLNQRRDGTQRNIALKLIESGQVLVEEIGRYQQGGLIIAEMSPLVYLGMLGLLGVMILVPMTARRG